MPSGRCSPEPNRPKENAWNAKIFGRTCIIIITNIITLFLRVFWVILPGEVKYIFVCEDTRDNMEDVMLDMISILVQLSDTRDTLFSKDFASETVFTTSKELDKKATTIGNKNANCTMGISKFLVEAKSFWLWFSTSSALVKRLSSFSESSTFWQQIIQASTLLLSSMSKKKHAKSNIEP